MKRGWLCLDLLDVIPLRDRLDHPDLDLLLRTAEAGADAAGAVIRPFFRAGVTTDDKSDDSPVTIADRNAEQTLRALIGAEFPDHGILGEEYGLTN